MKAVQIRKFLKKFDVSCIKNFYKIFNIARYCRGLGTKFLLFKKTFDYLPSEFDEDKYWVWMRQVFNAFTTEIPTFPAYFKLKEKQGVSIKALMICFARNFVLISIF